MITQREIMRVASVRGLRPQIIEKDYVLNWLLAGIYNHTSLKQSWIFKGGTCFKKCYFETYQFSEDLDFTITDSSHLNRDFLIKVFSDISDWLYKKTGIEVPLGLLSFDIFANPRGSESCQGKLGYRGPIGPRSGFRSLPRLKIDLTFDELATRTPVERTIHHNYSDAPSEGISARCYVLEEAFAEKIRALGQRASPRDLYDAINLFRNDEVQPDLDILNDLLRKKCAYRGVPVPTLVDVQAHRTNLDASWSYMLGHQLPKLPPFESYFHVLPEFFHWLETGVLPLHPAIDPVAVNETVLREPTMNLPITHDAKIYLEIIRFAAVSYLCVDLQYAQSFCRIEPYSLRRTKFGNILLYAIQVSNGKPQTYRIDQIQGATTTQQSFIPRYLVELRPAIQPF